MAMADTTDRTRSGWRSANAWPKPAGHLADALADAPAGHLADALADAAAGSDPARGEPLFDRAMARILTGLLPPAQTPQTPAHQPDCRTVDRP
jgi:hypothetical protein